MCNKNCMQGELRDKQKGKNDPPCMKCVSSDQISFMKTSERSNNNRQKTVKCWLSDWMSPWKQMTAVISVDSLRNPAINYPINKS